MKVDVECRSEERRSIIKSCAEYYVKVLNLKNSKFELTVHSTHNLRKTNNSNGEVMQIGYRKIYMVLESKLTISQLLLTLAHEMVHVKQIARGQYKGKIARNGRLLACWCGKAVRAKYEDRPWEVEAFNRQVGLVEMLIEHVAKKSRKKG